MKQLKRLIAVSGMAVSIAAFSTESAHAIDLAVLGNLNLGTQAQSAPSYSVGSTSNLGFGAKLAFDSFPTIKSELGALYVKRGMTLTNGSGEVSTSTYNYLMVPYVLRFEPISLISVGAGAYYAYGLGEYSVASAIPGLNSGSYSYESGNYSRSDFGLIAGASLKLPLAPLLSMRFDVDYAFGLTNLNSGAGSSANFRDLLIMAGVNFGF